MARVIVHVDLDAFYAAVEQVRLRLPLDQPLAVQQWEGLIAVNYAARAKGVTRFMAIAEAKQKCPDLKLVHVEVIGGSSRREEGKVSLERYRQASASILPIFYRFSPLCEKASIDEAYLDLTAQVEALLNQSSEPEIAPVYNNKETASASQKSEPISMATVQARPDVVVLDGPLDPSNEYDRRLLAGATIVAQLREAVFHELGYTCSAGIAPNKLLAKLASAMNKPYKQTVVTPRAVPGLMRDFPMRKIRNLGGKMGKELCDTLGCETAGDVQKIPEAVLIEKLGDKMGPWVFRAVRGVHDEPVQTRQISKSMLAAKSYTLTNSMEDVRHWLRLLSMELAARIEYDVKLNKRRPKTFHLYYRGFDARRRIQEHSKSCPVPPHILQLILQLHAGKAPKSPVKSDLALLPPPADRTPAFGTAPAPIDGGHAALSGGVGRQGETEHELVDRTPAASNQPERETFTAFQAKEPEHATEPEAAGHPERDGLERPEASGQLERELSVWPEARRDLSPQPEPSGQLERGTEGEWADGGQSIADGIGAALASGEHAGPLAEALYSFGLSVFEKAEHNMPSTRVAVSAGDFVDLPVKGAHSITNFFQIRGDRERETEWGGAKIPGGAKEKRKSHGIARFFGQKAPSKANGAGPTQGANASELLDGVALPGEAALQRDEHMSAGGKPLEAEAMRLGADVAPLVLHRAATSLKPEGLEYGEEGNGDGGRVPLGSDQATQLTGVRSPGITWGTEVSAGMGLPSVEDLGERERSGQEPIGERTQSNRPVEHSPSEKAAGGKAPATPMRVKISCVESKTEGLADRPGNDRTASDSEALCPELSEVDLRQQQRLMAEFERQKRLAGLVRKRDSEGGPKGATAQGKKGVQKRKGRPPDEGDGQKRISSFLKH